MERTQTRAKAITEALRLSGVDTAMFGKWEVQALPDILEDGELPLAITSGSYEGTNSRSASIGVLVATDRRAVFVDKGMLGSLTVEDFPYSAIQSVEASTGMALGSIVIKSAGGSEKISGINKGSTHELANLIRSKAREFQATSAMATATAVAPPVSTADELLKLAQLRDAGVLTDEEFAAQKAKLLG